MIELKQRLEMRIDLRPSTTLMWLERLPEDFRAIMSPEVLLTDAEADRIKEVIDALPEGASILDQFKAVEDAIPGLSRAERMNLICTLVKDVPYLEYCRLNIYLSNEDAGGNGLAALVLDDILSLAGVIGNRIYLSLEVIEMMRVVQGSISSVHGVEGVEDAPQSYM